MYSVQKLMQRALFIFGKNLAITGYVFTIGKGKGHPCTGTEALYMPYGL